MGKKGSKKKHSAKRVSRGTKKKASILRQRVHKPKAEDKAPKKVKEKLREYRPWMLGKKKRLRDEKEKRKREERGEEAEEQDEDEDSDKDSDTPPHKKRRRKQKVSESSFVKCVLVQCDVPALLCSVLKPHIPELQICIGKGTLKHLFGKFPSAKAVTDAINHGTYIIKGQPVGVQPLTTEHTLANAFIGLRGKNSGPRILRPMFKKAIPNTKVVSICAQGVWVLTKNQAKAKELLYTKVTLGDRKGVVRQFDKNLWDEWLSKDLGKPDTPSTVEDGKMVTN
eukprot:NODE_5429_length_947_cov_230.506068_g5211_i0.p1 GENE.NODE_5429_length_947_cov_230.506068_g5211_i0~~NODE_5429_length_947_cov_230.506068_g5211_i0.p1  ORF type:complete len:282 (-),score=46.47 NODE_5429_length_947_cov_230.506068_g5211_i0:40-885(-)